MVPALVGCGPSMTHARLNRFERRAADDDQQIESLAQRVDAFDNAVDDVLELYQRATTELDQAQQRYERAVAAADSASGSFQQAKQEYDTAARNWRLITTTILAAAAWDYAGHLCGTRMSTAAYRSELRAQGVDLEGLDADHGLPRSWGGADHPLNYEMIDSSLNRSLGNDVVRKLLEHPKHLLQGALVSALMRLRCSPQL